MFLLNIEKKRHTFFFFDFFSLGEVVWFSSEEALLFGDSPSNDKLSELDTDPTWDSDLDSVDCDWGVLLPDGNVAGQLEVFFVAMNVSVSAIDIMLVLHHLCPRLTACILFKVSMYS